MSSARLCYMSEAPMHVGGIRGLSLAMSTPSASGWAVCQQDGRSWHGEIVRLGEVARVTGMQTTD